MRFRELPSVDSLALRLGGPHALSVRAARSVIDRRRRAVAAGSGADERDLLALAQEELRRLQQSSPRPVLNATGVLIHTNLGRAPLAVSAQEAVARVARGYCALELDLDTGARGSRQSHVATLAQELTGAEAALVVNNGAGAVLLAVAALAGPGGAVVVSRGQLVEIGGGFRIPEVIEQAGARLVEVGTTNRTRVEDYQLALEDIGDASKTIVLRAHPSNFRTLGFVESVEIEALCRLGAPVVDDLGSGALARDLEALSDEPDVRRSIEAGAALVTFSGDKLLGGPQAGILVGTAEAVRRAARHPLARALRIDKLSLAALQATLAIYRDPELARREIPVLAMLETSETVLEARAERLRDTLEDHAVLGRGTARVGGGALPLLELHGPIVAVDPSPWPVEMLAARLRQGATAVVGRIQNDRLILDPRTLNEDEVAEVGRLVSVALAG